MRRIASKSSVGRGRSMWSLFFFFLEAKASSRVGRQHLMLTDEPTGSQVGSQASNDRLQRGRCGATIIGCLRSSRRAFQIDLYSNGLVTRAKAIVLAARMKRTGIISNIFVALVIALTLAGCGPTLERIAPGLPQVTNLPSACRQPDAPKPGSACAKALAEPTDDSSAPRDNRTTRNFLDSACADEDAWQEGSTCHALLESLQRTAVSHAGAAAQASQPRP